MKILNAIHAQNIGGVNQVFKDYTTTLESLGHDVALLISDNGYFDYKAKRIFRLKNLSSILDILHILWIFWRFRPDVVICHSPRLMYNMRLLRFTGVKVIGVNHGTSFKRSLHCDYVISVNESINADVLDAGFETTKTAVIGNVIMQDQDYKVKRFATPITIGMYGRLEIAKGFDILIAAGYLLKRKNIDFRLKMGGFEVSEDVAWDDVKSLAKEYGVLDRCEFVGVVDDKSGFFEDVDICCVPSRQESFGLVILEGFLHSRLVVSSDTDGGKMLIQDGVDGILFQKEDAKDLANKIEKLLDDSKSHALSTQELTQRAFAKLEKYYSFPALADKLSNVLEQVK